MRLELKTAPIEPQTILHVSNSPLPFIWNVKADEKWSCVPHMTMFMDCNMFSVVGQKCP